MPPSSPPTNSSADPLHATGNSGVARPSETDEAPEGMPLTLEPSPVPRFALLLPVVLKLGLLGLVAISPEAREFTIATLANGRELVSQFFTVAEGGETSAIQWLAIAFTTVFVAEMGDKTQLATMLMSAQGQSPWSIFIGSASALVAASLVSVTLGGWLSTIVPPALLQAIAGVSFVLLGTYVLWAELTGSEDDEFEIPTTTDESASQ